MKRQTVVLRRVVLLFRNDELLLMTRDVREELSKLGSNEKKRRKREEKEKRKRRERRETEEKEKEGKNNTIILSPIRLLVVIQINPKLTKLSFVNSTGSIPIS
jgi:hypothetical protein